MKKKHYKNFDDGFYSLTREIVLNPRDNIDYIKGVCGYIDDLVLEFDTSDCCIDPSLLGFTKRKLLFEIRNTVNRDLFSSFRSATMSSNSVCLSYDFTKGTKGGNLLAMVLTRHDARMGWKRCVVYCKSMELTRDLAVYLVIVHLMLSEIWKNSIEQVVFHIAQADVSAYNVCGCCDFFDIGVEESDGETPFGNMLQNTYRNYFVDKEKLSTYNSLRRMQEFRFDMVPCREIDIRHLSISGVFNYGD